MTRIGKNAHLTGPVVELVNGDTVDSDTVDLSTPYPKGFHANAAGTVKFNDLAGNTKSLVVNAGSYYPYPMTRLWATGHTTITAADIELAY